MHSFIAVIRLDLIISSILYVELRLLGPIEATYNPYIEDVILHLFVYYLTFQRLLLRILFP